MSAADHARFRVQAPNSTPRSVRVVALDGNSETVVRRLATVGWQHTTFLTAADIPFQPALQDGPAAAPLNARASSETSLRDLAGRKRYLDEELETTDLVILVAGPGGQAQAAEQIGQACNLRHVTTTGFVVGATSASEPALAKTLAQLRPWSLMVVIASSDNYIDDIMTALRA